MANKQSTRALLVSLTPPIFYPLIRNVVNSSVSSRFYAPKWHELKKGPFKGISLFFDASNQDWGLKISNGKYDSAFFEMLESLPCSGKIIFDVGAHIGLSSLPFARMVGKKGKVIAFEPNPTNRERLLLNVNKNPVLAPHITVEPIALSNKNGKQEFLFTSNIEDGTSSGSFLKNSHTFMEKDVYERDLSFKKMTVPTQTLDSYCKKTNLFPDFVKIDVEGAESLVLEGAVKLLETHKTTFFIELHSIFNGFAVTKLLSEYDYSMKILHEEKDGRVFIMAR